MTAIDAAESPPTERWSALGGVLLSALYLSVLVWLLLAVVLPAVGLGWQPVVITTGSMQPLIRPGDIVLSGSADDVEPGQVVTYEDPAREGSLTTHRIVSIDEDGGVRTQGDANLRPDSTVVPPENLVGRGRLLVPMIGLPLLWLSSGAVLFGLWVVVTAISVAIVVGADGAGGAGRGGIDRPSGPRSGGRSASGRRLPRALEMVRPGTVQRMVVGVLVKGARRLHDAVYRGHRPNPSRVRRGAPTIAVAVCTAALARTPASLTLGVLGLLVVLLFDVDGPQLRIGRWERVAARTASVATNVLSGPLGGRGLVVVVVVVAVAGSTVGRSAAAFSAAAANPGSHFTAAGTFATSDMTLWLQNDPEGADTVGQESQPMTTTQPTQATLPNYDTNADIFPGLRVKIGALDQYTTDINKSQRWRHETTTELSIASAQVVFHSAMKAFAMDKGAKLLWYLRHCDATGLDCVEMATAVVTAPSWQDGQTGFVERTASFGTFSSVVPAGRTLEIVTIVPVADDDLWFAYDTMAQQSRLELTWAP